MEITYLGHASFKIKGKKAALVTDPFNPKNVGLKFSGVVADIVTISHGHGDHNASELVKETQMVIEGPGEYEIKEVTILGLSTFHDDKKGAERGSNTIYVIEMEEMRLAHLGDLGHKLDENILNSIGEIDVLMIPIGGFYTIDSSAAVEITREIEPSIVIPMHYNQPGLNQEAFGKLENVDSFLKELGLVVEKLDKLSAKKSDLQEEQKVVVLSIK